MCKLFTDNRDCCYCTLIGKKKKYVGGNARPCFALLLMILQEGLQMFLGLPAKVVNWNANQDYCCIILSRNPLEEWVELPPNMSELRYSNIIGGAIRGALEMVRDNFLSDQRPKEFVVGKQDTNLFSFAQVHYKISCEVLEDALKGDDQTTFE